MSVSDRQLAANRRNALKSTGPRTVEGKKRVARNALKHGAYADEVVLSTENRHHYRDLHRVLVDEFRPASPTEHQLVQDLANYRWRLARTLSAETGRFNHLLEKQRDSLARYYRTVGTNMDDIDPADFELRVLGDAANQPSLHRLNAVESRLYRQYLRALQHLINLRRLRENETQTIDIKQDKTMIELGSEDE